VKLIEPAEVPETCFHGGAFFDAVGDEFDDLERRHRIINADVLDAWFPPSPGVIEALKAGANSYILKPFEPATIIAKISDVIESVKS